MNIIATANIILTLLPVVSDTVKNVETIATLDTNPTVSTGSAKRDFVIGIVKSIYDASSPPVPFDTIVAHISEVIAALVTFYNKVGVVVKNALGEDVLLFAKPQQQKLAA
jgi:hypothetical protein